MCVWGPRATRLPAGVCPPAAPLGLGDPSRPPCAGPRAQGAVESEAATGAGGTSVTVVSHGGTCPRPLHSPLLTPRPPAAILPTALSCQTWPCLRTLSPAAFPSGCSSRPRGQALTQEHSLVVVSGRPHHPTVLFLFSGPSASCLCSWFLVCLSTLAV